MHAFGLRRGYCILCGRKGIMEWLLTGVVLAVSGVLTVAGAFDLAQTRASERTMRRVGWSVAVLGVLGIIIGIWVVI